MGTKCRTGKRRQALRDAVAEAKRGRAAWLTWSGRRLRIAPPYSLSGEINATVLVRVGNRVLIEDVRGLWRSGRVVICGTGQICSPRNVVAVVVESHPA